MGRSVSKFYLRSNAARNIAPTIINTPPIMAIDPTETKNLPKAVVGPQGSKPLANVSNNAAIPKPKDVTP